MTGKERSKGSGRRTGLSGFVDEYLGEALAFADEVQRSVLLDEDLRGFREGIVVFGGHRRAVCASTANEDQVARAGRWKLACGKGLGVARSGCQDIPRFTTVTDDNDGLLFRGGCFLKDVDRVLGAIQTKGGGFLSCRNRACRTGTLPDPCRRHPAHGRGPQRHLRRGTCQAQFQCVCGVRCARQNLRAGRPPARRLFCR
jgi:hypothetical protein